MASARTRLTKVVNAHDYEVEAVELPAKSSSEIHAKLWKLNVGNDWTVPAIELTTGQEAPVTTSIVVADSGRASAAETVERLLKEGHRVLAVDPFYIGESKISSRDFLFALLVGAVGERPVGIQASQLGAIARWSKQQHPDSDIQLVAVGERMSLAAIIAAGLEAKAIDRLELRGSLATLKQVVERNYGVNEKPEFFCFGLLDAFDIRELAALVVPREVSFIGADDRAKAELACLKSWYGDLGRDYDPLR
jgi:hypothetical protein